MRVPLCKNFCCRFILFISCAVSLQVIKAQTPFSTGNVAVFVASASASNTTGSIVEFTTAGTNVITHAIPDGASISNGLRFSGSASSTGYLANSNDGTLLCFTGANTNNSSSNVNTLNPRGVGTFSPSGNYTLQTTYTGSSGNQTRAATSLNNTSWFIGDQGGFYSNGTSSASPSGNIRSVKAFGGTVYALTASASAPPVGTISAPTGGTYTALPGLSNGASSRQDFYLLSSGSNGNAFDILYILDATADNAGTIFKYSLVNSLWTANGSYTTNFGGFGIAVQKNGNGAFLYVSEGLGAKTANRLIKLNDAAGYNTTINIATTNNTTLYTAAAGTIIKGVAFAPASQVVNPTITLSVNKDTASEAGQSIITVTATSSAPVSGNQSVSLIVSGTGITSADYSLSGSTITIPDGSTSGSINFTVKDDSIYEGTETAVLTIGSPTSGISLGTPASQSITIADNDSQTPAVNLSVSTHAASEAAQTVVTVTANAASVVSGDQTVSLNVSGTGITAGDYTLSNTVITIPDGSTSGSVTFTVVNDTIYEGTDTAIISISSPSAGITLGSVTSQSVAITDDDPRPAIRITEYMYGGVNGEFVEFTNVGTASIDMTGWSFDDNSRVPGSQGLGAFGNVQPGESVILTESNAGNFRAAWNLCNGIKIIGGNTNNLGRDDEINLYNTSGTLVERLTYGDDISYPGTIRTNGISGYVNAAGLGNNDITQWTLSSVGDVEGSYNSAGGDIGSPGKSTRAVVAYNPCTVVTGAPTILINVDSTTNYLDGGVTASPLSPYGISGVISDPTDPASLYGIYFTISDDATDVNSLTVTVSSSNPAVVPAANLVLSGNGALRNLKINPAAVGYSNITVSVSDGTYSTSYIINYAASAASFMPSITKWHTGMSDASDAIALSNDYFVSGDDELDVLNVYSRSASGLPATSFNYSSYLNLPDPSKPEVDVEAATRSTSNTNRIYWLGSMSNGKSPFDNKPNRDRLFATDVTGTGTGTAFSVVGYGAIRSSLIAWGDAHGYNFSSSAAAGVDSKTDSGFAAEGMVFAPDGTTLYVGMRAPLVPIGARTKAVIAPITNFEAWFNNGTPSGNPTYGNPVELNLGGRGIRDLIRLSTGTYIIIAGSSGGDLNPAIYKWTGYINDSAELISSSEYASLNMEGAMESPNSSSSLQVISDYGDVVLYNDGSEAKDLSDLNFRKFRSDSLSGLDFTVSHKNLLPVITITNPSNNSFYQPGTITVQASASDPDGIVKKVEFFNYGNKFAEDSTSPYSFTGSNIEPGVYLLTAKATDDSGAVTVSDTVHLTVTSCSGSGNITVEGYTNIPGSQVADLTSSPKYPDHPDVAASLGTFEYGTNLGDNYGARVRGYICAPATGAYNFYIAGDDQDGLWLSTDDNPANKALIAYNESYVNFRAYYTYQTQKSASINLVKGKRYYIETLHKEAVGNDHLSVGWQIPGGVFEGPIPGVRLSPYIDPSMPMSANQNFASAMKQANNSGNLTITAAPNPSSNYFIITAHSSLNDPVSLSIMDVEGRVLEINDKIPVKQNIKIGSRLKPGVYFIKALQREKTQIIKVIKQ